MKDVLAAKILDIDRGEGSGEAKLRRLIESLSQDDLATLPGRWIHDRAGALLWEDNLVDWATARLAR
ncbi:MAG: hypothetical protein K6V73_12235 [Firmicutes bacterium]|nr:hypothetical protein [Bacillota bacterium]